MDRQIRTKSDVRWGTGLVRKSTLFRNMAILRRSLRIGGDEENFLDWARTSAYGIPPTRHRQGAIGEQIQVLRRRTRQH